MLAGRGVQDVRKLGVGYGIPRKGKASAQVRGKRFKSGRALWRRLCKAGLKNHGTRVVYAGILPHMLFGAALYRPVQGEVKRIQGITSGVGLKRPLGDATALVQSVDRSGGSGAFVFAKEAIGRWAREVGPRAQATGCSVGTRDRGCRAGDV